PRLRLVEVILDMTRKRTVAAVAAAPGRPAARFCTAARLGAPRAGAAHRRHAARSAPARSRRSAAAAATDCATRRLATARAAATTAAATTAGASPAAARVTAAREAFAPGTSERSVAVRHIGTTRQKEPAAGRGPKNTDAHRPTLSRGRAAGTLHSSGRNLRASRAQPSKKSPIEHAAPRMEPGLACPWSTRTRPRTPPERRASDPDQCLFLRELFPGS